MIRWVDKQPRMTRSGGLFCFGDVVPDDYFTEAEIADLVARGKIAVELEQPKAAELEQPKAAELEQPVVIEPEQPEQLDHAPEEITQALEELEQDGDPGVDLGDGVGKVTPIKKGKKR